MKTNTPEEKGIQKKIDDRDTSSDLRDLERGAGLRLNPTPHTTVEGEARTQYTEVEEIFGLPFAKWIPDPSNSETVLYGYPKEHLEQAFHHQLQKAREEAYSEGWKVGFTEGGGQERCGEIPEHSELDQPINNQTLDELIEEFEYRCGEAIGAGGWYVPLDGLCVPVAKEWLRNTLHHQLQKARQDWLREEIVKLDLEQQRYSSNSSGYELGAWKALQTIIDRYQAELDQDNK